MNTSLDACYALCQERRFILTEEVLLFAMKEVNIMNMLQFCTANTMCANRINYDTPDMT